MDSVGAPLLGNPSVTGILKNIVAINHDAGMITTLDETMRRLAPAPRPLAPMLVARGGPRGLQRGKVGGKDRRTDRSSAGRGGHRGHTDGRDRGRLSGAGRGADTSRNRRGLRGRV